MTELELCLPVQDITTLLRSALVTSRGRSAPANIVWHDTPDHALEQKGLLLARTRQAAWMERLHPDPLAPAAWPPATSGPTAVAGRIEGVAPVAAFHGSERVLGVEAGGTTSTLRLRQGALQGVVAQLPCARISLVGEAQALSVILPALGQHLRLQVPRTGLAADALALARGRAPVARWLGAPQVPAGLPVGDIVSVAIGQLTDAMLHWSDSAGSGETTEPVHQMRVALRRLRAALSVFRHVVDCHEIASLAQPLRDLSAVLGEARDWDVFLSGLGPEVELVCAGDVRVPAMLAAARRRRAEAYVLLRSALSGQAFRQVALGLAAAAALRPWQWTPGLDPQVWRCDGVGLARLTLGRRLHRVLRAGKHLSDLPDDELHELRKDCKKLRYAAELFAPMFPGHHVQRFTRRLAAVQEALGLANDGAVSAELLAGLGRAGRGFAAGVVRGYVAAGTKSARRSARQAFRTFRRTAPFWAEPAG